MSEEQSNEEQLSAEQRRLRELRVSDQEREHVVGLLKTATGRGLIDLDEFSERADTAYAARTRGELNKVLIDLPGLVHPEAAVIGVGNRTVAAGVTVPIPVPGEQLVLRAHGSNLVRKGQWTVPSAILVRNRYGDARLDFSEANMTSDVVHIELDVKWGSVHLIIPEHASLDLNALNDVKWSSVNDKTRGGTGAPRFVVTGRLTGSSLNVRHPRRGLFSF